MDGFGLVVRFTLKAGHEAAFDDLVARTAPGIREGEPDTLIYLSHTVADQPSQRIFYELYRDQAAFEYHERQPHVTAFLAARTAHLESFTVDVVRPIEGKTG